MKELSIKDKAKAYDEAIERAKKWRNAPNVDKIPTYANRIIEEIFPELKESEDEKIRKGIIKYLEQSQFGEEPYQIDDDVVRNYIAWLEKQKQWSEEDENKLKDAIKCVHHIHTDFEHNRFFVTDLSYTLLEIKDWLKSLTPQSHWKPTDYQIALLEELARNIRNNIRPFCSEVTSLEVLIEQIKTL